MVLPDGRRFPDQLGAGRLPPRRLRYRTAFSSTSTVKLRPMATSTISDQMSYGSYHMDDIKLTSKLHSELWGFAGNMTDTPPTYYVACSRMDGPAQAASGYMESAFINEVVAGPGTPSTQVGTSWRARSVPALSITPRYLLMAAANSTACGLTGSLPGYFPLGIPGGATGSDVNNEQDLWQYGAPNNDFGPPRRCGMAASFSEKFVVRAGYGIYY